MHKIYEGTPGDGGWDKDLRGRHALVFDESGTSIDDQINNFKTFVRALIDDGLNLSQEDGGIDTLKHLYEKHVLLYNQLQPGSPLATTLHDLLEELKGYIERSGGRS